MKFFFILSAILSLQVCAFSKEHTTYRIITNADYRGTFNSNKTSMKLTSLKMCQSFDVYPLYQDFNGRVEKVSSLSRTYAFQMDGKPQSIVQADILSSGSISDMYKQFTVYDHDNNLIGRIEGSWPPANQAASFNFLDAQGQCFAKAQLDLHYRELKVTTPSGLTIHCEKSMLEIDDDFFYCWDILEEETSNTTVDPRFLIPFTAFIAEVWYGGSYMPIYVAVE